jgi:hypothetical protein
MTRLLLALVLLVLVGSSALAQSRPALDDDALMSPAAETPVPAPVVAPPLDPEKDPGAVVAALTSAVRGGKWVPALGLVVLLLVWAARRFGARLVPWFATARGGVILSVACAGLLVIGGSLATGWSWSALLAALEAAAVASGVWSLGKNSAAK